MKSRAVISLITLLAPLVPAAQNDSLPEDSLTAHFKAVRLTESRALSPVAKKEIAKGDRYFLQGPDKYPRTLGHYREALKDSPDNAFVNFKVGKCYLDIPGRQHLSVVYLEKAWNQDRNVHPDIGYHLGRAYHLNMNFEAAIEQFTEYRQQWERRKNATDPVKFERTMQAVDRYLAQCRIGMEMMARPERVFIDNLGERLNSEYADYDAFVSADESEIYFTSRRKDNVGGGLADADAQYYEDILHARADSAGWGSPERPGRFLNRKTNDAVAGMSLDGQQMLVYRDRNRGDIYLSKLKGREWTRPRRMRGVNSPYRETSACFSGDGNTLYLVSDRPGGVGGKDIYRSRRIGKSRWSEPVILDSIVNTVHDEDRVYIHPGGGYLYFSSKGHDAIGGYDIFVAEARGDTAWAQPVNLGYPVNSAGDDLSFIITANGKAGYFASARPEGKGDKDLYRVTFLGPEKQGVLNTEDNLLAGLAEPLPATVVEPKIPVRENKLTLLRGVVKDDKTGDPVGAVIEITDNERNEVVATFRSNAETGRYIVSLKSGGNYGIAVVAEDYLFHSENVIIPASVNYQVIGKDFGLKMFDVGSRIVLKNIFFDYDKATLRPESGAELDRLTGLLKKYRDVTVEISGHTDNVGSEEYNKDLSRRRAEAVVTYLAEHGVARERLTYEGYGFDQPLAPNDSDEGRQLNRRTEFRILSTGEKK